MNAVPKPTQHPLAGPSITGAEMVHQVFANAGVEPIPGLGESGIRKQGLAAGPMMLLIGAS